MKNNLVLDNEKLDQILSFYIKNKPTFLSVIRAKEAAMFNYFIPFEAPILDYGCGDGFFREISNLNSKQKIDVGLETDSSRAKLAEKRGIYEKVVVYDGKKLPFRGNSFKTIISNSVFEHVKGIENAVFEMLRVLKPNGVLITSVMAEDYEDNLLGVIFLGRMYKKWMRYKAYHQNMFSDKKWDGLFRKIGFKIEYKIPYLDKKSTRLLDFLQYVSIPNVIFYKVTGRYSMIYFKIMHRFFKRLIKNSIMNEEHKQSYSAYFYVLRK